MPRKPRLDFPGLLQHVIVRGIERKKIFINDDDRAMFINRFSSLLEKTGMACYAWALLPNHAHFLLRPNGVGLATFMRRLLTGYAVNFNRRYNRAGHLFQNRYKSIVCEEESYFLELVRYIHLNPLRARVVADLDGLDSYPWSGHAVLMGNHELIGQKSDDVLLRFGKHVGAARHHYRQFVEDGLSMGKRPELVGGGLRRSKKASGEPLASESHDDRILGSGAFVDNLRQEKGLKERLGARRISLTELLEFIARLHGVEPEDIRWRSKQTLMSEARAVFCCAAVRMLTVSGAAAGNLVNMQRSAVSQAVRRGARLLAERPAIKAELENFLFG